MKKAELELLLRNADLAIKDLEKDNANLKARNEALTRFVAAVSVSIAGMVEPKRKAIDEIRAALSGGTDEDRAIIDKIAEIINSMPEEKGA